MIDNDTETALEMAKNSENKLYKVRGKSYPEISAEQKHAIISAAVAQHRAALARNSKRRRVDLRDPNAVEAEIDAYLTSCEEYGQVPTLMSLAVFMGYSRANLYAFIHHHPDTESAKLIDAFRSASASIIAEASMNRTLDNATSIFLLKNCGQGLNDRQEIEISRGADPSERKPSAEEIAARYAFVDLPD
jgi:hypothetical protein